MNAQQQRQRIPKKKNSLVGQICRRGGRSRRSLRQFEESEDISYHDRSLPGAGRENAAKAASQLIIPLIPPHDAPTTGRGKGTKNMKLSWYSALKKASRKLVLQLIPGGESPLDPGMKRVRWTCAK